MGMYCRQRGLGSMYIKPINEIYKDIEVRINQELEEMIVKAVRECDIEVDRDELIKALQYDRNQYEKGFADALDKIRAEIMELDTNYNFEGFYKCQAEVIGIIDKYRSEGV